MRSLWLKRLFDVAASAAGLLLLAPLLLAIAVWIRLDSPGPVFFRQERVGLRGQPFRIFKFRSMRADNAGPQITVGADERITRSGTSNEPIGIQNGGQVTSVGMKFTGGNVSAMWRGIGSSGQSGTLKRAYTSSTLTGSPTTTSADAGFGLTDTSIAVA